MHSLVEQESQLQKSVAQAQQELAAAQQEKQAAVAELADQKQQLEVGVFI